MKHLKITIKSVYTLLIQQILQYLVKLPFECCDLFLIGEGDVQSRGNGIDELDPMLFSCTDEGHQLV